MAARKRIPLTGNAFMIMPDGTIKKWATIKNLDGPPEARECTIYISDEEAAEFCRKMSENASNAMQGKLQDAWERLAESN